MINLMKIEKQGSNKTLKIGFKKNINICKKKEKESKKEELVSESALENISIKETFLKVAQKFVPEKQNELNLLSIVL